MNARELLRAAAAGLCSEGAYDRHSRALAQSSIRQPYGATLALERASCRLRSGAAYCARGDAGVLAEAKARVCRTTGYPHVDAWEATEKPTWQTVRQVFERAAA